MSQLVPRESIELTVGVPRHATEHWAKAVSYEHTVYILHSQACLDSGIDLRDCDFSVALDDGIHVPDWPEDVPLHVVVDDDFRLLPLVDEKPTGPTCEHGYTEAHSYEQYPGPVDGWLCRGPNGQA